MQRTDVSAAFSLGGMNDAQRTEFWASLALRHTSRLGPRTWKKLLEVYPSPYSAVLDVANWVERAGVSARMVSEYRSERWRGPAREEWNAAGKAGWRILLWTDPRYPNRLKEITDPPIFLYYMGDAGLLANPGVGVVGSRLCSRDGIATTRDLCRRLSASGVTTVSGLARGIDSEAHKAALESWGSTIAVLGTGPDCIYPPENADLHARICDDGLVLSEFPPGTMPEARNFPMRNRIISGLSLGVLVVEAAKRSGSLITARHALDQGREVFAVPGRVQARTSSGCHDLIRQGAKAVFACDDVLVEIAPLIGINADEWKTPEEVAPRQRRVTPPSPAARTFTGRHAAEQDDSGTTVLHGRNAAAGRGAPKSTTAAGMGVGMGWSADDEDCEHMDAAVRSAGCHRVPADVASMSLTDDMTPDELELFKALSGRETMHIDDLCRALDWQASKASAVLLMLEVQGAVRQLPGMHYSAIV
ncbi:DNA-processing protein DprA [Desulfovibrio subterraneus]|uniref:DNA-processing protein DprA n=1 Tax=Desulfovibrio subterraneus TaxID=2718620 RepID=UPI0022B9397C|nr:DNA-processing protein DprA [Desulfovibrio subterraneus]WBF67783.1 DNA-processing protein DprA [Desulfovibrio subterraneus]